MDLRSIGLATCLVLAPGGLATAQAPVPPSGPGCEPVTADNAEDCLRVNHLQVIGTHNSYHVAPDPAILAALGDRARAVDYTHRPLAYQLEVLGMRQFEIDVYADPEGGAYASPDLTALGPGLARVPGPGPELREPGLKVLHTAPYDFRTTCATLRACLTEIRDWSRAHPRHVPIAVMIEVKDPSANERQRALVPHAPPFDAAQLDSLDAGIRAVFDDDHLLTPDDVRGGAPTLRQAIAARGWPTLRDARGKVLFLMDNTGPHRELYLAGRPTLEGRVMFVSVEPTHPAAAFAKMNDALGDGAARIAHAVRSGLIVRTRADEPGREAHTGDTTRRDAALGSGAQYVSTDYPEPSPYPSGSGYVVQLPGTTGAARCSPVSAPRGCRDEWVVER